MSFRDLSRGTSLGDGSPLDATVGDLKGGNYRVGWFDDLPNPGSCGEETSRSIGSHRA